MSLAGLLLRNASLENPTVPISDPAAFEWLTGASAAGVPVTEDRVYGLTAWYRGVALLSGVLAGLPFKAYRDGTNEQVQTRTTLDNPNPAMTPFEFWQTHYAHAISWGTGYARKVRDGADVVRELWPVHPSAVTVEPTSPTRDNPSGKVFKVVDRRTGEPRRLTSWDLFETPYLSLDGRQGVRPLQVAREALGIALATERTTSSFYRNGGRLSGVLQSKKSLSDEGAGRLKRRFEAKLAGPDHAGSVAVLDQDTEFKAISISPQDAELLESRRFSVTEIARLLGIPPHLVGDVTTSTSWGTGIAEQTDGFVKFTLLPWLLLIEQRVDREVLPGGWYGGSWYSKHSVEGLLRGTPAQRAQFYHQGITDGWLSREEVRSKEDLIYVEGLDEFLVPSNLTLISVDGTLTPLSANGLPAAA